MSTVNRILTYALGLFLISSGAAKFAGGHVFQYIEYKSGVDVFYPFLNNVTGIAESIVGLMILAPLTRLAGAIGGAAVMGGAIGFHLSPWLGVSMPTDLIDGAAAPWTAADFSTSTTSVTFVLAIVTFARSASIARSELRRRSAERSVVNQESAAESVAV